MNAKRHGFYIGTKKINDIFHMLIQTLCFVELTFLKDFKNSKNLIKAVIACKCDCPGADPTCGQPSL